MSARKKSPAVVKADQSAGAAPHTTEELALASQLHGIGVLAVADDLLARGEIKAQLVPAFTDLTIAQRCGWVAVARHILRTYTQTHLVKGASVAAFAACQSIRFAVKNASRHRGEFSLNDILAADRLAREALGGAA